MVVGAGTNNILKPTFVNKHQQNKNLNNKDILKMKNKTSLPNLNTNAQHNQIEKYEWENMTEEQHKLAWAPENLSSDEHGNHIPNYNSCPNG